VLRNLYILLLFFLLPFWILAQSTGFTYQGIAIDQNQVPVKNKKISLKLSILTGSVQANTVYSETQGPTTDSFGQFSVNFGSGTATTGNINNLQWDRVTYFLKVEADISGASNYGLIGTSQIYPVPYALSANSAGPTLIKLDTVKVNLAGLKILKRNDSLILSTNNSGFNIQKVDSLYKLLDEVKKLQTKKINFDSILNIINKKIDSLNSLIAWQNTSGIKSSTIQSIAGLNDKNLDSVLMPSVYFDGLKTYVAMGPNGVLGDRDRKNIRGRSFTVEGWIKSYKKSDSVQFIFGSGQDGWDYSAFRIYLEKGRLIARVGNYGFGYALSADMPTDTLWHHIAFVHDNLVPTGRLFLDGVEKFKMKSLKWNEIAAGDRAIESFGANMAAGDVPVFDFFKGNIRKLRVSKGIVYSADFNPSYKYTKGDSTLAFWELNEGSGTTINCSDPTYNGVLYNGAWQSNPTLNLGLVAYYPFNGNANDSSGNGNNGVVSGATLTTDRNGSASSAYLFNGSNSFIDISNKFFNNGWDSSTVTLWFNPDKHASTVSAGQTFFNTNPHRGEGVGYSYRGHKKVSHSKSSDGINWDILFDKEFNFSNVTLNNWYHVVIVKSNLIYNYYINGVLVDSFSVSKKPAKDLYSLRIGAITCCGLEAFSGKLDDFRFYNRALGSSEVINLYNSEKCTAPSTPTIGTITQPTTTVSTGSVALSGLPQTGTWTVTATGGSTKSGTGSTTTFTGLSAGTYKFTVTNSNGCTSAATASSTTINASPITLTSGLIAYYPFSGNANDSSGNGKNGVVSGATLTTDRFGKSSSAYEFNGSSYITTTISNLPIGSSDRTISFWAKQSAQPASPNKAGSIFHYGSISINNRFSCLYWPETPVIILQDNDVCHVCQGSTKVQSITTGLNTWNQIILTVSNNRASCYVNGQLFYYGDRSGMNTTLSNFIIGKAVNEHEGGEYFKGSIDDIRIYNRALDTSEINLLYSTEAKIDLKSGLVAYYPFNGNANDSSGNGNNGIVSGAVLTTDRFGKSNAAYDFNGSNSFIDITNKFYNNGWDSSSISLWFKPKVDTNALGQGMTLLNTAPHNGEGIGFSYNKSKRIYHWKGNANGVWDIFQNRQFKTIPISTGIWHNMMIVKKGLNYTYYVNGKQDTSFNISTAPQKVLCSLRIGAITNGAANSEIFNGAIDDIRIYNRALDTSEVNQLYNTEAKIDLKNGLVAYYPFTGNANDSSGYGNNGTVNGATLTTDRFNISNNAYSFNGTNNFILVKNTNSISVQSKFSVSVWVLMNGGGCNPRVFEINQNLNSCGGYTLAVNGTSNASRTIHIAGYGSCDSAIYFNPTETIPSLQWNHILYTVDGETGVGKFYLNGKLIQTKNGSKIPTFSYNNNDLTIGNINSGRCDWWGGKIDDLRIYSRILSDNEITYLSSN